MRTITVKDLRPGLTPKTLGTHKNIPAEWTVEDIVKRYGIRPHLTIEETTEEGTKVIRVAQP